MARTAAGLDEGTLTAPPAPSARDATPTPRAGTPDFGEGTLTAPPTGEPANRPHVTFGEGTLTAPPTGEPANRPHVTFGEGTLTAPPPPDSTASPPRTDGVPPSLYERFEDFVLLGRGGMGAVYRARDSRLRRTVAVKLLHHGAAGSRGGFLQEARSQARILHPRVCEVFEAGIADHVPFIVMRYVAGEPLGKAHSAMSIEEKAHVLREIALALHEAHRLGVVHRDVKPGNILVERGEDGAYRPYIADFGIAGDVSAEGEISGPAIVGTPAYMAPEQAAGKLGALDRRTDVYGLGVTLYTILAGRPPFVAARTPDLLREVISAPPPPLVQLDPTLPLDLAAIVHRCLEKDPAARYESARALAEDLQRFLDGDPVAARPRSLGARLYLRARKNKGRVAAGAVVMVCLLVLAGLWVRSRRIAAEREAFARDMGSRTREMELFLRGAQTLPLHDLERERDVLRARLREVETLISAAGDIGLGPGNDALGRGHLALQDARTALDHFQRAEASGYRAPGLDYAVGLALIELYRRELESTNRIQNPAEKAARVAEIEGRYRDPALVRLRAALAQGIESPEYALGLVAHHEGRHEDALSHAKRAFEAAPWLHEAKKLEGDVLFAIGSRTRHDKAGFDYARTMEHFERAAEAYRAAAEVARSDPQVHEAECELWIQAMNAAAEHGDSMSPHFDRAKAACERAISASPRLAAGRVKLAWAHLSFAFWAVNGGQEGSSADGALARARERIEAALAGSPDDAFARYLSGAVWRSTALRDEQLGRDAGPAIDRAVAGYESALAKEPTFLWALNEQCGILAMRGRREALIGADPTATFDKALARCKRAAELDPTFPFPAINTFLVWSYHVEWRVAKGLDPKPAIERGLAAAADGQASSSPWAAAFVAELHRREAEHALLAGGDPHPALAKARAAVARLPESFDAADSAAEIDAATAEVLVAELESRRDAPAGKGTSAGRAASAGAGSSQEPPELSAAITRARKAFTAAVAASPEDVGYALWLSRVELLDLRRRAASEEVRPEEADAALSPLRPFLERSADGARLQEALARAIEMKVNLRERLGPKSPREATLLAEDRARGIAAAEKLVRIAPGLPAGHALLGRLLLGAARSEADPARKKDLAGRAADELDVAVSGHPLLRRDHASRIEEAKSLAGRR